MNWKLYLGSIFTGIVGVVVFAMGIQEAYHAQRLKKSGTHSQGYVMGGHVKKSGRKSYTSYLDVEYFVPGQGTARKTFEVGNWFYQDYQSGQGVFLREYAPNGHKTPPEVTVMFDQDAPLESAVIKGSSQVRIWYLGLTLMLAGFVGKGMAKEDAPPKVKRKASEKRHNAYV